MGKAAELAEARGRLLEFEAAEGVGIGAVGPDSEAFEEGAADQVRRPSRHLTDTDIDAGLAKIDGIELRMGVGDVQDARVAEPFEIVNARGLGATRQPRQAERGGSSSCTLQEITAADRHSNSPRLFSAVRRFHEISV